MTNQILVKSVVDTLREQGKKIATAESCTGGMLAQLITSIPGASEVFDYGIVSYANSIKQDMLNVDEEILNTYGAVSEQVATAMATGVMKACNADIGVGITGIAGPDGGTIEKPIGTVYVCIATPDSQNCCRLDLGECCKNNRSKIRDKAIYVVLDLVLKSLFNVPIVVDDDALYDVVSIEGLRSIDEAKHKAQRQTKDGKWYQRLFNYWIPQRQDTKKQITLKILSIVCILALLVSGGFLLGDLSKYWGAANTNDKLQELYESTPIDPATGKAKTYDLPSGYSQKFGPLFEINPDVKGWLKIEGTKIDFPVVQAKDNDYYLRRNFYKKHQVLGVTFADYRDKIQQDKMSTNTILYSHNAKDGQFFSDLEKYKKLDFYREHPAITFNTVYEENQWVILGAFMVDSLPDKEAQFNYHNFIQANTRKELDEFISRMEARSYIKTNIDVDMSDSLLTLSTCDYEMGEYNKEHATYGRFVVVARKLRTGENAKTLASTATSNQNQRMPFRWYEIKKQTNPFINDADDSQIKDPSSSNSSNSSVNSNSQVSTPTATTPEDDKPTSKPTDNKPNQSKPNQSKPDQSKPGSSDPGSSDPGSSDPGSSDPGSSDPGSSDPGSSDPGSSDPGSSDPGSSDPGSSDPGSSDPGSSDPGSSDPGSSDPGSSDPGSSDPVSSEQPPVVP